MIATIHEAFRNTSMTRPPQPAAPLTRLIECRPVGGHASGVPLYFIYPNDIWGRLKFLNYSENSAFHARFDQNNTNLTLKRTQPKFNLTLSTIRAQFYVLNWYGKNNFT